MIGPGDYARAGLILARLIVSHFFNNQSNRAKELSLLRVFVSFLADCASV